MISFILASEVANAVDANTDLMKIDATAMKEGDGITIDRASPASALVTRSDTATSQTDFKHLEAEAKAGAVAMPSSDTGTTGAIVGAALQAR